MNGNSHQAKQQIHARLTAESATTGQKFSYGYWSHRRLFAMACLLASAILLLASIFALGIGSLFDGTQMIVTVVLAVLLYCSLAESLDSIVIKTDADSLRVYCAPLPYVVRVHLRLRSIALFQYREAILGDAFGLPTPAYQVIAVLRNRDEVELLSTDEPETAQLLAQSLERHLRSAKAAYGTSRLRSA